MKTSFFFFLGCFSLSVVAQSSDKDFVLTTPLYNAQYQSQPKEPERDVAKILAGKSLQDLVKEEIIDRKDMRGFALPLGIHRNELPVNFQRGMYSMWLQKGAFGIKKGLRMKSEVLITSLEATQWQQKPQKTLSIRDYRGESLTKASEQISAWHSEQDYRTKYSEDRGAFMDIVTENLSPNVLLGYNIQELMPPSHLTENGEIKKINPLFKAYFLDRLLQEAGPNFVAYFPSRYDAINSFGPFQFTPIAIADINENKRLNDDMKVYQSMSDLKNLDDHALLAAVFAYNNWERLSFSLKSDGTLEAFNAYFQDTENNVSKKRQLRILIAGITASMHHHPPETRKMVRSYLKNEPQFEVIHHDLVAKKGNAQLKKYYRSAAEAYLLMKIYHQLIP